MSDEPNSKVEQQREMIVRAQQRGPLAKLWTYTKLSGPGWLQSAITLGGGSLSGSLYVGVLAGVSMLWLQPLAMMLGIVMLSAIGYVALSTDERPFLAVRKHVNPVLGWGWAIATMMANFVWCLPQFSLGTAALQQNLMTDFFDGYKVEGVMSVSGNLIAVAMLFVPTVLLVMFYDRGGWGIRLFEWVLKIMVGTVVVSFFAVVYAMNASGAIDWSAIGAGLIPNFNSLSEPAGVFQDALRGLGESRSYWEEVIVREQRGVFISAFATAVGINMTFLLPYSMLQKGWDKDFRGLAIFDLSTGLFIPYVLATGCVVIAAANAFHGEPFEGLIESSASEQPGTKHPDSFVKMLQPRLEAAIGTEKLNTLSDAEKTAERNKLPLAERRIAAMLVPRDADALAKSLQPLTGDERGKYLFGIGVLGMAVSTIIILMLINGFVVCEILGVPSKGMPHRIGAVMAGLVGAMGPFFWSKARFYLAVPTSMIGMVLLPIAYLSFFGMMNSKSLLGENRPKGAKRVLWNTLMGLALAAAICGSLGSIFTATGTARTIGLTLLCGFLGLAVVAHFVKPKASS